MTERGYYFDSYTRAFSAQVREQTTHAGRPAVVLDRTFFYPASGGQPNDRGALNGIPVEDVLVRESDQAVLHVLAGPLNAEAVQAVIEWPRRFDHMQQHTGQHILSQAFIRAAQAVTVGFHLGAETVTIDLNTDHLPDAALERAEQIANEAVFANHPVRAWFPSPEALAGLALRRTPEVGGPLRVVAIGDFDLNACGGTHVKQSAEVGLIKILKVQKQKKGARVEFVCGARALADYGRKHAMATRLANDFTSGLGDVPDSVARLRADNQSLRKDLRAARDELLAYEAARLLQSAREQNGLRLVRGEWAGREMNDLRALARRVTACPGVAALLGAAGDKSSFVFARSPDLKHDMNTLFNTAIAQLPGGRGGGTPALAQGGGAPATTEQAAAVLDSAERELLNA